MAVMPEGRDTEEPDAGHDKEQAAGAPPEDILARLLEYRRRLREEMGDEPAVEDIPAEPVAVSEKTRSEQVARPEPTPTPTPRAPHEGSPQPPDARQLKERIDRLDETLARISAMLPLLRGEADRGEGDPDPKP